MSKSCFLCGAAGKILVVRSIIDTWSAHLASRPAAAPDMYVCMYVCMLVCFESTTAHQPSCLDLGGTDSEKEESSFDRKQARACRDRKAIILLIPFLRFDSIRVKVGVQKCWGSRQDLLIDPGGVRLTPSSCLKTARGRSILGWCMKPGVFRIFVGEIVSLTVIC